MTMAMTMMTMMAMTNTKTTEELAAATSALGKDANEIAGLIVYLTRYISPLRAVSVDVEVINGYVDWEEEGKGGEGADENYDENGNNGINGNSNALETQSLLSSFPPYSCGNSGFHYQGGGIYRRVGGGGRDEEGV